MPRPIKIKFRNEANLSVSMDNAFTQDTGITEEKVFDDDTNVEITSITISGPLVGHTSPLVITLSNKDDCTISVEYEEV